MKGAPERVLELCTHFFKGSKSSTLTAVEVERIHQAVVTMASKGLRGSTPVNT